MSIANYNELQTAVMNWLVRPDLSTYVKDLIMLGEKRIQRDLRIRCMDASFSTLMNADGTVTVPADYVEMQHCYLDLNPIAVLERKAADWIYTIYPQRTSNGIPAYFARDGGYFIFGKFPDQQYTMVGRYYCRLPALSDSNTTNWFTANAPEVLLFAALCEAEPFLKNDGRLQLWESKYSKCAGALQVEDNKEAASGSVLASVAG